MIHDTPCIDQPMRFGNKAFRTWLDCIIASAKTDLQSFSNAEGFERAIPEIEIYLIESFGQYERLDYGTGHELNFVAFLFCMFKVGVFMQEDLKAAINVLF